MSHLIFLKNVRLVAELSLKELAVESCDMLDRNTLRAFHFAGSRIGAVTKAQFVHLRNHRFCPFSSLRTALRKKREGTYPCGYEKHCRAVFASSDTSTATDAGGGIHGLLGSLMRNENSVGILS